MNSSRSMKKLIPFAPTSIQVLAQMEQIDHALHFEYQIPEQILAQSDISADQWTRKDELWKETCFEYFFKDKNLPGYFELNFSAKGHWNCYHFDSYRCGMKQFNNVQITHQELVNKKKLLTFQITAHFNKRPFIQQGHLATIVCQDGLEHFYCESHPSKSAPDFHKFL